MKAIVLCAGRGSRLAPDYIGHKILVPVAGRRILEYLVDGLHHCGIEESDWIFVVGWNLTELVHRLPRGSAKVVNDAWETTNTTASLKLALDVIKEPEDVFIINGDVVAEPSCFTSVWDSRVSCCLVNHATCHQEEVKYRLTVDGVMKDIGKTLDPVLADGEVLGINKVVSRDFYILTAAVNTLRPTDFYDIAFNKLAMEPVALLNRLCVEIDFPDDWAMAERRAQCLGKANK